MLRALAGLALPVFLAAQPEGVRFFEESVRPILAAKCFACHSQGNRSSGLALDSREAVLEGGNRGEVVKPGDPESSLLSRAISYAAELKMPPTGRLQDEEIGALRRWIEIGLPWPEAPPAGGKSAARHWAFEAPQRHPAPPVRRAGWVRNPIDNFILARLEKQHLAPSPEADPATLLRRASLDLTGIPPSPAEVREFLAEAASRPDAYERAVDRLLRSPHYGERWGRHWLDVARYADSNGYNIDGPRDIWKYRDWVIQALNRDLPFDQFVIEQVAGDMLPGATLEQKIATGFHRNTPLNLEGGIDFEQYRVEAVADRVATTGAAFLGLTLGCARCHDHKYDPVTQREFYRLYAFFNNVDEMTNGRDRKDAHEPVLELGAPDQLARRDAFRRQAALLEAELKEYEKALSASEEARKKDPGYLQRQQALAALRKTEPVITSTLILRELAQPREAYIHLGGDFLRKGAPVAPGVPAVFPPLEAKGRPTRLDFARWLVSPANPLTARVTVNRFWQAYFGKGLVETENDFGTQGALPTHPELLDWLATEFIARGWSQKAMHRLIVTSAAYRQSSRQRAELAAADPNNRLLGRQNRLRLEAEIVRDAALAASALLNRAIGGASVYPPIPEGALAVTQIRREWPTSTGPDRYRRGMYTFFWRSAPPPGLMLFDAPDATAACTRRNRSNTPLQALTLLNDQASVEFAQALGARILKEAPASDPARADHGFLLVLGRAPSPAESQRLLGFVAGQLDDFRTRPEIARDLVPKTLPEKTDVPLLAAWISGARVLLNLDEFMTRE
ncbi:MAG: DUF1553 domain-containing protein [Acidobacteria bacterium]|nr:DUF1553 domain-containing protein [Acidobacteriota bacterium]